MQNTSSTPQEGEPQAPPQGGEPQAPQPEEPLRDPLEVKPGEVNLDPDNPFGQ
ncbi:hypothetical protein ACQEU6_07515 [Spirillospora sp. CA-108201]